MSTPNTKQTDKLIGATDFICITFMINAVAYKEFLFQFRSTEGSSPRIWQIDYEYYTTTPPMAHWFPNELGRVSLETYTFYAFYCLAKVQCQMKN